MSYIQVKNISKRYPVRENVKDARVEDKETLVAAKERVIFDDLNLEFEDREMVCILGPSGCGKSTLLRIMSGFDKEFEGEVIIGGKKVVAPNPDHIFVFQKNGLLPWLNVWDNVGLGLRKIEDVDERNERIREYIEMAELEGFENHFPGELSGGMQRRAELARGLAVQADVLYLDEPFTGLDYFTHLKIREEVINIHEYIGKTMIMVTHFIEDALVMADRIIILSESPVEVKMVRELNFSRPRNINKDEKLIALRDEIFLMLGISYVA